MNRFRIIWVGLFMGLCAVWTGCAQQQVIAKSEEPASQPSSEGICNESMEECENRGLAMYHSEDVELQNQGLLLIEELCGRKSAVACEALGIVQAGYDRNMGPRWHDVFQGAEHLLFACENGRPLACNNLGVSYAEGRGVPEDQFKAVEFFRRACDGDHGRGCANLAWRYSIGVGIEKSDEMEMVLTKRACDLDDGIGCGNLAILVGDSDPEEQTRLYEKACKLGRIRACVHYVYHVVEEVDPKKAARAYEDLCEMGESEGCHFRASLALRKEGNLELGKAFAEKSCVHANFRGCRLLADAYQGKFGGTPDYTEANRLYEIACTHRVHAVRGACLSWADNIEKGYGVPADPERDRELRERATQLSR